MKSVIYHQPARGRTCSDPTSLAIAREIKNSNSSNLSLELPSKACATFHSTDDDDDDINKYEFPPDALDDKSKIFSNKEDCRFDDSFNSGIDDKHAEPEVESPCHIKRSTSYRKAAFNSTSQRAELQQNAPIY